MQNDLPTQIIDAILHGPVDAPPADKKMLRMFTTKYPHACRCAACEHGQTDLVRADDGRLYCQSCIDRRYRDWHAREMKLED